MTDEIKHQKNLQDTLAHVIELLKKQELVTALVRKQQTPRQGLVQSLVERQHLVELERKLRQLHPADVAFVLENLPLEQRQMVWDLVNVEEYGAILLEVSDAVRESLIADLERGDIVNATENLSSDEIADLVPDLPADMALELLTSLDSQIRTKVQSVLAFPEGTVGALMDFDMVTVREDIRVEVVLRYLRWRGKLPHQIDQLFVVDRNGTLKGLLPLKDLLINDPEQLVTNIMLKDPVFFYTDDTAREVSLAFERYDLISAPVVNLHNQLVGCIGIDVVMDFVQESSEKDLLGQVGLSAEEDLFAPLWKSGKNRWAWLAFNLMTAFISSRVIGLFETTIGQIVALAALMPIVSGIGGNTGNQTATLIIRGLALNQINTSNLYYLVLKEIGIGVMNGSLWGSVVGLFAFMLYYDVYLSLVMTSAMILNLLLASLVGVFIPLTLHKIGRDPVLGTSVLLTAVTDSMGFFFFLGLATVFLV